MGVCLAHALQSEKDIPVCSVHLPSLLMRLLLILALATLPVLLLQAQDDYQPGPDSIAQANVPKGELIKGTYTAKEGSVFPGTEREYTIYLPATYNLTKASIWPFMVFQDGVIYNAPVVFDNLIAKGQIPPLIGIFIKPGVVPAANPNALPRYNRSYEYDSVSDTYSRFLIDEFLPAIEAKHGLKLSTDPNDAAITGISSGGICAFMTAWHRPDRFRRVFSGVGTYVGIHGADQLPVLVRKFEPKPLRIYLQSGEHDNDLYCGDWWMANQTMERALKWAGYDVNHTWGTGGHNAKHATAIFPNVLRWLWRDYSTAKEINANPRGESKWVGYSVIGDAKCEALASSQTDSGLSLSQLLTIRLTNRSDGAVFALFINGNEYFSSSNRAVTLKPDSNPEEVSARFGFSPELTTLPSGDFLVIGTSQASAKGKEKQTELRNLIGKNGEVKLRKEPFDELLQTRAAAFRSDGKGYAIFGKDHHIDEFLRELEPDLGKTAANRAGSDYIVKSRHPKQMAWLAFSPDQNVLYVSDRIDPFVYTMHVDDKGFLRTGQRFFQLEDHVAFTGVTSNCDSKRMCVDTNGWLYVATALGIQVCDQAGRVNFIIPTPQQPYDVCFGGKDLGELFIACGDKIYKRPTKAHGIVSGQMAPIKPAPPKL